MQAEVADTQVAGRVSNALCKVQVSGRAGTTSPQGTSTTDLWRTPRKLARSSPDPRRVDQVLFCFCAREMAEYVKP